MNQPTCDSQGLRALVAPMAMLIGSAPLWLPLGGGQRSRDSVEISVVVSAASHARGEPLAPGSIVTVFGKRLASSAFVASGAPLPRVLGQTSVKVNGFAAPLYFASPGQIDLQFPFELSGDIASVAVVEGPAESKPMVVRLARSSPAIFGQLSAGGGPGLVMHSDWTPLSQSASLRPGEIIIIYATGLGPVRPGVESGVAAPATPLAMVSDPVRVLFDGVEGRVEFAGLAPLMVGIYQINVAVPAVLTSPYPTIKLDVGSALSNGVTGGGPGLLEISPVSVTAGNDVAVTIRGKNFSTTTILEVGGERLSGKVILDEFRTTIPARLISAPGRFPLTVINKDGGAESRSNSLELTVTATVLPVFSPNVYVIDSLSRVGREDPEPLNGSKSARIFGARNQYEGFQVVIHGGATGWKSVTMEPEGPLAGPQGAVIPAEAITLYREHYVTVSAPSNGARGGARAGVYPDALIPFKNPFTGQPLQGGLYPSAPFNVPAGQNQPVYVELLIPSSTPAGLYSGSLRVTRESGTKLADVPLTVMVWDFDMPRRPSIQSGFQDFDSEHLVGAAQYYRYVDGSPAHLSLAKAIDEAMIAHRLMPQEPLDGRFSVDSSGRIQMDPERESALAALLGRVEYSTFKVPFETGYPFARPLDRDRAKSLTYLRDVYRWLSTRGFMEKSYSLVVDEPSKASDFQQARAFADLLHEAHPSYRFGITGELNDPNMDRYLEGRINLFIAGLWSFDPAAADRRQAAGQQVWSYTALVQNEDNPSPFWQIDFPLLNYRIVPWINYRYGLVGLAYWTTDRWRNGRDPGQSPWVDPCVYRPGRECYNGEGMLLYPGKEVNFVVPQGAYGLASATSVYGVVPSLRLKALRDGMQDYELLALAGGRDYHFARRIAIDAACLGTNVNCFHSWNRDSKSLYRGRRLLADLIAASR